MGDIKMNYLDTVLMGADSMFGKPRHIRLFEDYKILIRQILSTYKRFVSIQFFIWIASFNDKQSIVMVLYDLDY